MGGPAACPYVDQDKSCLYAQVLKAMDESADNMAEQEKDQVLIEYQRPICYTGFVSLKRRLDAIFRERKFFQMPSSLTKEGDAL